jgi:RNA polymerase sigma-70 factor (ECF subfamily)
LTSILSVKATTMDYTRLDDETLIRLIARAHENALGELYDRYSRLVYSVAMNTLGDPGRAEEVTQDVFERIWEKAGTYSPTEGRVISWLTSIARHRSIDLYRQSRSHREDLEISWQEAEAIALSDGNNTEWEAYLEQRQERIRWAVAQLPLDQKQALGMAFFLGYSHQEIADLLHAPLGTVKTRIRLGMQKLRALLYEEQIS